MRKALTGPEEDCSRQVVIFSNPTNMVEKRNHIEGLHLPVFQKNEMERIATEIKPFKPSRECNGPPPEDEKTINNIEEDVDGQLGAEYIDSIKMFLNACVERNVLDDDDTVDTIFKKN